MTINPSFIEVERLRMALSSAFEDMDDAMRERVPAEMLQVAERLEVGERVALECAGRGT
jgi:hypothetical protein